MHMAEDQGMALVSRASLRGGSLKTKQQREEAEKTEGGRPARYGLTEKDLNVLDALEEAHQTPLQAVVSPRILLDRHRH